MIKKSLVTSLVIALFLIPFLTSAAVTNIWEGTGKNGSGCNKAIYSGGKIVDANTCTICDGAIVTVNVIEFLLVIAIVIAVLMVLYGAVRLMIAGGSQTQVSEGKDIITKALIGLLIVSSAWIIVNTIFKVLTTKTDWNTLDFIGCPGSHKAIEEGGEGKQSNFKGPEPTAEELKATETQTEGTEVAPITDCNLQTIEENSLSNIASETGVPTAHASAYGDKVVAATEKFIGKLYYSNEKTARRDPTGKSEECKALIKGTKYTGCGDCSGFAFKMYGCAAGENIGQYLDDNVIEVNSAILKNATLPDGLKRYYTENLTYDEIKKILKPGDILGFDVTCHKRYNSKAGMGHVMIFKLISGDRWEILDHGSTGGARKHDMNTVQWKAFYNCGYIIHIKE